MSKKRAPKRYIDTSSIPTKWGGRLDWMNSKGCELPFEYGDIKGVVKIKDYDPKKSRVYCKIDGYEDFDIFSGHLVECKLAVVLDIYKKYHIYEVGHKFGNTLQVMEQVRVLDHQGANIKAYVCHCSACDTTSTKLEGEVKRGERCSVCTGRTLKAGFNDVATTDKWAVKYFKNKEDATKVSKYSEKEVVFKCPDCGHEKKAPVYHVCGYRFSCSACGGGASYPEKLMGAVLRQLNVDYVFDRQTSWSLRKRYDFYFEHNGFKIIVETHGEQHYSDSPFSKTSESSFEEIVKVDKMKEEMAKDNGIDYYIVIDCRKSEHEYIKSNILNSELSNLFDMSNIDWVQCEKTTMVSRTAEVCELWNQGLSLKDIREKLGLGSTAVTNHLKKGMTIGIITDYTNKESLRRTKEAASIKLGTAIRCVELDLKFNSFAKCEKYFKENFNMQFSYNYAKKVCDGELDKYKGYTFEYVS